MKLKRCYLTNFKIWNWFWVRVLSRRHGHSICLQILAGQLWLIKRLYKRTKSADQILGPERFKYTCIVQSLTSSTIILGIKPMLSILLITILHYYEESLL